MNSFKKNIYRITEEEDIIIIIPPDPILRTVHFVLSRGTTSNTNTTAILYNNTKSTSLSFSVPSGSNYTDVSADNFAEAGDNITIEFGHEDSAYTSSEYNSHFSANSIPVTAYVGSGIWSANNEGGTNHQGGIYPTACPFSTQSHTATGVAYMNVSYNFTMPAAEPEFTIQFGVI